MNRTLSTLALLACLSICLPERATAVVLQQQPVESTSAPKSKTKKATATKPTSKKAAVGTPKSTTTTATTQADRPGKRFWGRIMGAFRDVHSVEKQRKEY